MQNREKNISNPLSTMKFPTIVENGKLKAFIVDAEHFSELEILVDNLINLREESEDKIITNSGILEKLVDKAVKEARSLKKINWEQELDEL